MTLKKAVDPTYSAMLPTTEFDSLAGFDLLMGETGKGQCGRMQEGEISGEHTKITVILAP